MNKKPVKQPATKRCPKCRGRGDITTRISKFGAGIAGVRVVSCAFCGGTGRLKK